MPPDISIIILNWNTAQLTHNCLTALSASFAELTYEVIVVDNASSDNSVRDIHHIWPKVRLIENSQNLGFAGGNNVGLRQARGRYTVLLNSDTLASILAFATLAHFLDENPQVGAVGPRLCLPDGEVQAFAFGNDPTPVYLMRRAINALIRRRALHDWRTEHSLEVGWVSGACLMVRRQAYEQIGLLDENFFMYFEDNDWCLRLRQNGWKVFYHPSASITHLGGQSRKLNPSAQTAYDASLRYFYTKHYSRLAQIWLGLFLPLYRRVQTT